MGPSVSFPLPLRIAQKLPVCNSWALIVKMLPIPFPIFYYLEFFGEVLANTGYLFFQVSDGSAERIVMFKDIQVTDLDVTDLVVFGPLIPFCATGALWGRVAFFSITLLSI